jgi:hypothetical protein
MAYEPPASTLSPASLTPLAMDDDPYPANDGSRFGRWIIVLAAVAGLGITLYRNDVFQSAAQALDGVAVGQAAGSQSLALTPDLLPGSVARQAEIAKRSFVDAPKPKFNMAEPVKEEPKAVSLDSLPTEKANADAPKKPNAAVSQKAVKGQPKAVFRASKSKSRASEYDPLNPKL